MGAMWRVAVCAGLVVVVASGCTGGEATVHATVQVASPQPFTAHLGQDLNINGEYVIRYESASDVAVLLDATSDNASVEVRQAPVTLTKDSTAPERGVYTFQIHPTAVGTARLTINPVPARKSLVLETPPDVEPPPYTVSVTVDP
jgi:hypothetical protein